MVAFKWRENSCVVLGVTTLKKSARSIVIDRQHGIFRILTGPLYPLPLICEWLQQTETYTLERYGGVEGNQRGGVRSVRRSGQTPHYARLFLRPGLGAHQPCNVAIGLVASLFPTSVLLSSLCPFEYCMVVTFRLRSHGGSTWCCG